MTPEEIYKKLSVIEGDNTFSLSNIQQLCEVLGDWRPKGVIELGSLNGRSTAFWALMADRVWTIDIVNRQEIIRENLKKLNLQDKVQIKVGDSKTCYWDTWADVVKKWNPRSFEDIRSGADISFFYDAMLNGYKTYGIWDLFLPHITKFENGDVQIIGRLDKNLLQIFKE